MKITQILLILLLIAFSSCQRKPMNDIDFETKNHKLYFLSVNEDPNRLERNVFLRQHRNFYIDDVKTLNKIKNNSIKEETERTINFQSDYELCLIGDNNKQVFDGKIDLINGLLYSSGKYYNFNSEFTVFPKVFFKPVEKSKIEINSFIKGRKLIKLITDNNGLIKFHPIHNFIDSPYNAMTIIRAKKDYLGASGINQKVIEKVKNDLKGLGEVKIEVSFCNTRDYCTFHVCSEKLNADAIPSEYDIIKPLSDSIVNMPIIVYNISINKIKMIMRENNIEMKITQQE